jgi:hypothetical protein
MSQKKNILHSIMYIISGFLDMKEFVKYARAINLRILYKLEDNLESVTFDYERKIFKGMIKCSLPSLFKNRFLHEINPIILKQINQSLFHPRNLSFSKGKPMIKLDCGFPLDGPVIKFKKIRQMKYNKPIRYSNHFKPQIATLEEIEITSGVELLHDEFSISRMLNPPLTFLEDQFTIFDDIITSKTVLINSSHCVGRVGDSEKDKIIKYENLKSLVCSCNGIVDNNSHNFYELERTRAGFHPFCVECNRYDYKKHNKICPYNLTKEDLCLKCNKLKEVPDFASPFRIV